VTQLVNVAVIGCRSNTKFFVDFLIKEEININHIITISNNTAKLNEVPDYFQFKEFNQKINIYEHENYTLKNFPKNILKEISKCEVCFCIGWQRIIPQNILSAFSFGVFGMHATEKKLPIGKGRSPINWAIINGAKKLYGNIIKYDDDADNGQIYSSSVVDIIPNDNIHTIQQKLSLIFSIEAIKIVKETISGYIPLVNQNKYYSDFFYSKRSEKDGLIKLDWTVKKICDFVRAQTFPYPGAFFATNLGEFKVWACQEFSIPDATLFQKFKNGEIIGNFSDKSIIVNCVDGLVLLTKHNFPSDINLKQLILMDK
tara:strand:- start:1700 stop:2641 length:942 start_codon:yes stop_codon:yes gene_type:complete